MYQVGALLVYGIHGVCRVLEEEQRVVDRKKVTYLVLEPVGQEGAKFLVPTHNAAAMAKLRPLLGREELTELLEYSRIRQEEWIQDENRRKQLYRELIGSGDRERLLAMICSITRHKQAQLAAGKKCHLCDDNFLRDAEKLFCGEISMVMDMEPDMARIYLHRKLNEKTLRD